jgi:hypothetical protein
MKKNNNIYKFSIETGCSTKNKTLCDDEQCDICNPRRLSNSCLSRFFSNKNKESPFKIFVTSSKYFYFDCDQCGHTSYKRLNNIKSDNLYGFCSYCVGKDLCGNESCQFCWNKSFASHPKAAFWSDKNDMKPWMINKGSKQKYYFHCDICTHELYLSPGRITNELAPIWCRICHSNELCQEPCSICFEKSLATCDKSK